MDIILLGEIVNVIGIKGEVKVKSFAQSIESFSSLDSLFIGKDHQNNELREFSIEKVRPIGETKGNMVGISFSEIKDRNNAEALVGSKVYIREDYLKELPEDTYYVRELIGLEVFSYDGDDNPNSSGEEDNEKPIGTIKDVIQNTAQDIYVIHTEGKDVMVPAVKEFIKEVNISEGYIKIHFIEGML